MLIVCSYSFSISSNFFFIFIGYSRQFLWLLKDIFPTINGKWNQNKTNNCWDGKVLCASIPHVLTEVGEYIFFLSSLFSPSCLLLCWRNSDCVILPVLCVFAINSLFVWSYHLKLSLWMEGRTFHIVISQWWWRLVTGNDICWSLTLNENANLFGTNRTIVAMQSENVMWCQAHIKSFGKTHTHTHTYTHTDLTHTSEQKWARLA